LGQAGRGQQLYEQSVLDQQREANRMAAYEPYERLGYMGAGMGNVMGGAMGQYQSQVTPNQSPLQQALGIASLGLGAYKAFNLTGRIIMYNRTLNRPMFRRGGRAGGGIMTGVQRQGYDDGLKVEKRLPSEVDVIKEAIGERPEISPYPYKASDFFMGLGANILAQPGGQPIFQTIGKAGIDPLKILGEQNMSEYGK
jgi:hypothetical protein